MQLVGTKWRIVVVSTVLLAVSLQCERKAEALFLDKKGDEDSPLLQGHMREKSGNSVLSRKGLHSQDLSQLSTISFAADNNAWMYINGRFVRSTHNSSQVQTLTYTLNEGDVVAIMVGSWHRWYGVIADVNYMGKHYVTGQKGWKARKGLSSSGHDQVDWKTRGYTSCDWPRAISRPKANQLFPGKASLFPYKHGAKYVWASGASATDSVLLRLVVGGERCRKPPRSPAKIKISTGTTAVLHVNGKRLGVAGHRDQIREIKTSIRIGDVISVTTENRGSRRGVAVDIRTKSARYRTGQAGWKAIRLTKSYDSPNWMMKWYDSCEWPEAVICSFPGDLSQKKERRKLIKDGAKYVCSGEAGSRMMALRFVVGGENCLSSSVLSRPQIGFNSDKSEWIYVNGRYISLGSGHRKAALCAHSRQVFGRCEVLLASS